MAFASIDPFGHTCGPLDTRTAVKHIIANAPKELIDQTIGIADVAADGIVADRTDQYVAPSGNRTARGHTVANDFDARRAGIENARHDIGAADRIARIIRPDRNETVAQKTCDAVLALRAVRDAVDLDDVAIGQHRKGHAGCRVKRYAKVAGVDVLVASRVQTIPLHDDVVAVFAADPGDADRGQINAGRQAHQREGRGGGAKSEALPAKASTRRGIHRRPQDGDAINVGNPDDRSIDCACRDDRDRCTRHQHIAARYVGQIHRDETTDIVDGGTGHMFDAACVLFDPNGDGFIGMQGRDRRAAARSGQCIGGIMPGFDEAAVADARHPVKSACDGGAGCACRAERDFVALDADGPIGRVGAAYRAGDVDDTIPIVHRCGAGIDDGPIDKATVKERPEDRGAVIGFAGLGFDDLFDPRQANPEEVGFQHVGPVGLGFREDETPARCGTAARHHRTGFNAHPIGQKDIVRMRRPGIGFANHVEEASLDPAAGCGCGFPQYGDEFANSVRHNRGDLPTSAISGRVRVDDKAIDIRHAVIGRKRIAVKIGTGGGQSRQAPGAGGNVGLGVASIDQSEAGAIGKDQLFDVAQQILAVDAATVVHLHQTAAQIEHVIIAGKAGQLNHVAVSACGVASTPVDHIVATPGKEGIAALRTIHDVVIKAAVDGIVADSANQNIGHRLARTVRPKDGLPQRSARIDDRGLNTARHLGQDDRAVSCQTGRSHGRPQRHRSHQQRRRVQCGPGDVEALRPDLCSFHQVKGEPADGIKHGADRKSAVETARSRSIECEFRTRRERCPRAGGAARSGEHLCMHAIGGGPCDHESAPSEPCRLHFGPCRNACGNRDRQATRIDTGIDRPVTVHRHQLDRALARDRFGPSQYGLAVMRDG